MHRIRKNCFVNLVSTVYLEGQLPVLDVLIPSQITKSPSIHSLIAVNQKRFVRGIFNQLLLYSIHIYF